MGFSEEYIQRVWAKGRIVQGQDSAKWRKDECDAWIGRAYYGNRDNKFGWEIDHIKPESQGGSDELQNLRPLQWQNNASKQDGRLVCVVTSSGNDNVSIVTKTLLGM